MKNNKINKKAPISKIRERELLVFCKKNNININNLNLLNTAFSHRSYVHEQTNYLEHNERLEFLGDSVLSLVITNWLYLNFSDLPEGDLSRIRSAVVSEDSLCEVAKKIEINKYLLIGKGEENSGGRNKKAILADCTEAVIASIYLDLGMDEVKKFIERIFIPVIYDVVKNNKQKDYKSALQEFTQKKYKTVPRYELVSKSGPDHNKVFTIKIMIKDLIIGQSTGSSKKEAEQNCAKIAYNKLVGKLSEAKESN